MAKRDQDSRRAYKGVVLSKTTRLAIYLRDSFTCVYCLADMHGAAPSDITLDHVRAHADGGDESPSNLVTACRHCNCSRRDLPLTRFAGPEARQHIRRNTRRSMRPYVRLAKAIFAGATEDPRGNK